MPGVMVMPALLGTRPRRSIVHGLLGLALSLGLFTSAARPAQEKATGEVLVKAPHAILMDADSGAIMFQRGAEELIYPASMSKLMLLAVLFKALKTGEVT